MYIIVSVIILLLILVFLFKLLLKQSKNPSGKIGVLMMRLWNNVYLPMVKWSVSHIPKTEIPLTILDVGVGNGASTRFLSDFFSESTLLGIDYSPEAIKQADSTPARETVCYKVMDVQQLSCKASEFDYIFAFQTHFHWENLSEGLLELKRTLKLDGEIILTCEYAKINYYLPHLRENQEFSKYLESLGLLLKRVEKSKGWIAYFIQKKE